MIHRQIEANGISIHFVEHGEGPAVLFCHGFPAIWSSWKFQIEAVAAAGYKTITPDMRGYGATSAPADPEFYTPLETVGDLIAILDAAGIATATVVGHDFGANIAWNAALMRPDRFTAVSALSVQYRPAGGPGFLELLRAAGKTTFYMFDMMKPESDQAWANAAVTVPGIMYWTSGEAPEALRWHPFDPSRSFHRPAPAAPQTIDPAYIDEAVETFARTGFHGALNYYRAVEPFIRRSAAFAGLRIHQPAMFLAGELDGLNLLATPDPEAMRKFIPNLRSFTMLDGIGHWPQLEAPAATNAALLAFLQSLPC